jgi:prepilin-type processing-associated H-X9-DG protein
LSPPEPNPGPEIPRRRRFGRVSPLLFALLALGITAAAAVGLRFQASQMAKTSCLSNERRISTALLLYAQDHDSCLPPPECRVSAPGVEPPVWRHWGSLIDYCLSEDQRTVCPILSVEDAREERRGYPFTFSYGLNQRFYGFFGEGSFPVDNLELPERTILLTESERFKDPAGKSSGSGDSWRISSIYTDYFERPSAFPAAHEGRINVAAADGHVKNIEPARAGQDYPGVHDRKFGRLGGSLYNWNGGHPNGRTFDPPRD